MKKCVRCEQESKFSMVALEDKAFERCEACFTLFVPEEERNKYSEKESSHYCLICKDDTLFGIWKDTHFCLICGSIHVFDKKELKDRYCECRSGLKRVSLLSKFIHLHSSIYYCENCNIVKLFFGR